MTDTSPESKDAIRERILTWRDTLSEADWRTRSKEICKKILETVTLDEQTVMLFATKDREVNLEYLLEEAPGSVEFCLPATDTGTVSLTVYPLEVPGDLLKSFREDRPVGSIVRGPHDIFEPSSSVVDPIDPSRLDRVLVPGLAFDEGGDRIGYGEGYYDKFLASLEEDIRTTGVCFDEQLLSDPLPVADHDVPVERVVTDRRIK